MNKITIGTVIPTTGKFNSVKNQKVKKIAIPDLPELPGKKIPEKTIQLMEKYIRANLDDFLFWVAERMYDKNDK